jgi:cytochrome c biogenesis protein ResB
LETASEARTERVSASATVEREQTKPVATRIWNFLISIKLAIWILILLAVTSILGTVIEQNQPMEKYLQAYGEGTIRLMDVLQLFDMYHSWWFLLLLSLFSLNLACCTIDRLPRAIRTVRHSPPDARRRDGADSFACGEVEKQGRHLTVGGNISVRPFRIVRGGKKHIDLPFSVRNNRFWMETYPNGQPKEYSSDLSVIENGREVLRKTFEVNDPLAYKGIWFYQWSGSTRTVLSAPS